MKKIHFILIACTAIWFASCQKEHSEENGLGNANVIGLNCRISSIGFTDTASGVGVGSVYAIINSGDSVTDVADYDSLTGTLNAYAGIVYVQDTAYLNADEYLVRTGVNKVVTQLHGLFDPTDPFSQKIIIAYSYDAGGYLVKKQYSFAAAPTIFYEQVDYTYTGGNMTHAVDKNLITGDTVSVSDAEYNVATPKNFIYVLPDESVYQDFTQFFNFGAKPTNAISKLTVKTYTPGNVLVGTAVSVFNNYTFSVDQYVLSCIMSGDDQPTLPALAGRLNFDYHCK